MLQAQVDEANAGKPADFAKWRERARAALRVAIGPDHPTVLSFDKVNYGLIIATESTPQTAFD